MSPRAAWRLESMGFEQAYDYAAGKADWGSFGLPSTARRGSETRVGAYVRTDVPNCRLDDRLQEVCRRLDESGWDTCFDLNTEGVVLGRIGRRAIRGREDVTAEEAMTLGPSTIRPSARLREIVERMQRKGLTSVPVTTPDGRLVGLLTHGDAEHAFADVNVRWSSRARSWRRRRARIPRSGCAESPRCARSWRRSRSCRCAGRAARLELAADRGAARSLEAGRAPDVRQG